MPAITLEWLRAMHIGWASAEAGNFDQAKRCYEYANEITGTMAELNQIEVNPDISLLRHRQGEGNGLIHSLPPDEDMVISLEFPPEIHESPTAEDMELTRLDKNQLKQNIQKFTYQPNQYHLDNIKKTYPHIMVMSTGRCGTVSLYHLFEQSHYLPFHTYFFQVPSVIRYEMVCRFISGNFESLGCADDWVKTRAAEWLGTISEDRPMIGMNHLDTVFAPIFASIHPESKFIYLRRDPEKVFKSFYSKNQWSVHQFSPVYYKFDDQFHYRHARFDTPGLIAWHIAFTETFSRAFGETMGDRFIEISSDSLFDQDIEETERLQDFAELGFNPTQHFGTVFNEKAHKKSKTDEQVENGLIAFRKAYERLI